MIRGRFGKNFSPNDCRLTNRRPTTIKTAKCNLGPEYAQWLQSGENGLADRVALATDSPLRIISPLPGSTYVVDPDIPSSRSIPLAVTGAGRVSWKSDSLRCVDEQGRQMALASEGEHRLVVTDLDSGRHAETWIRVRSL